jgi:ferric-dicitrate binding protein FerR (iron transport regulator)
MFNRSLAAIGIAAFLTVAPDTAVGSEVRSCIVEGVEGGSARYWQEGIWADLRVSLALSPESKISTGQKTRVKIVCDDRIVVTIGTATEINLEQLVGSAGPRTNVILQLIKGIVGIIAPKRTWRRFDVRTPIVIASVRSTEWLVENDPAGGSAVFVRAGEVAVSVRESRTFALSRGEGISISTAGIAGEIKVWGAGRIAKSTEALGFDW